MSNGSYQLPNGREVSLRSLSLGGTYSGASEGSPESLTPIILKQLRERAEFSLRQGKPLVIQEPAVVPLPPYRLRVDLESSDGVKNSGPEYRSELSVCFFASRIDVSIDDLLEPVLKTIDWEANAHDFDILF